MEDPEFSYEFEQNRQLIVDAKCGDSEILPAAPVSSLDIEGIKRSQLKSEGHRTSPSLHAHICSHTFLLKHITPRHLFVSVV